MQKWMANKQEIEQLLDKLIEQKHLGDPSSWTRSSYEALSEDIFFIPECTDLLEVVLIRDFISVKRPAFSDAIYRVDAPVDKNAKFGFFEPIHIRTIILCHF